MRKRKRDWPQCVYDYAVVDAVIPEGFWLMVHEQRDRWQELAALHQTCRQTIEQALKEQPPLMLKAIREVVWGYKDKVTEKRVSGVWNHRADIVLDGLHWEYRDDLLDRFNASCTRAAREKLGRYPNPFRRSRSARLAHRYTGGGKPISDLAGSGGWRCCIPRLAVGAQPVRFGISAHEALDLRVHFHRLPPAEAIVKRVVFCGSYTRAFGWDWRFQLTVEEPPPVASASRGRVAAVDLGWRKMEGYIRVGYLVDNDGQELELRLPLPETFSRKKRKRARKPIVVTHDDAEEMQSRMDALKDDCKTALRRLDGESEILRSRIPYFAKTGISGLTRLLRDLREAGESPSSQAIIQEALEQYRALNRTVTAFNQRALRRRRWLYGNLLAWLRDRYDSIVIEDSLSVKDMTEAEALEYGLKKGVRYERQAAIGELRAGLLRLSATQQGKGAYTTLIHYACGATMKKTAKLFIECEACGQRLDQDRNAAINLITQTSGLSKQEWGLRNSGARRRRQVIDIPRSLKAVTVLVQP